MNQPTCHEEAVGPYSTNEDKTDAPYHCEREDYETLVGPDGFECRLGEPEDRIWIRDGRQAVERLNQLHETIVMLRHRIWALVGEWNARKIDISGYGKNDAAIDELERAIKDLECALQMHCTAEGTPCRDRIDYVCPHCEAVGREQCRRQIGYPCLRK